MFVLSNEMNINMKWKKVVSKIIQNSVFVARNQVIVFYVWSYHYIKS